MNTYTKMHEVNKFAVYEKTPSDGRSPTYIIAKIPTKKSVGQIPSSVLRDFRSLGEAIDRLDKWSVDFLKQQQEKKKEP